MKKLGQKVLFIGLLMFILATTSLDQVQNSV